MSMESLAPQTVELVIVSGVSGSGKSTALKAFEDIGYQCVDNLPAALLSRYVDYLLGTEGPDGSSVSGLHTAEAGRRRFALLIDCRDDSAFPAIREVVTKLRSLGVSVSLLFFDCQDEVVIRRFRETRRPHPMLIGDSLVKTIGEALLRERALLAPFREKADMIIDTSSYSVHDLRKIIERYAGSESPLEVFVTSFGFKYGAPTEADLLLDVRFLKNPHFVPELRPLNGLDPKIVAYVYEDDATEGVVERYSSLLDFLIPRYQKEGKRYLTIGIGCTGGKHRSVAVAEAIAKKLDALGHHSEVIHRDIERDLITARK